MIGASLMEFLGALGVEDWIVTLVPPPGTTGTAVIDSGVVSASMALIIAPGFSGTFAVIVFLITKYGVMLRKNPS